MEMSNNGDERKNNEANGDDSVRASFTDAELDNALAGFEREFQDESKENSDSESSDIENSKNAQSDGENQENSALDDAMRDIEEASFEEDLEGLLGNKAKVAMIITYVEPAQLLAAFCKMADVSAKCFDEEQGAVAILKNLKDNGPEEDVKEFVDFFRGMDVMLIVNRADKITAKIYQNGVEPQEIVAPMALAVWSRRVEDLAICMETVDTLAKQDVTMYDSDDLSDFAAYKIFNKYGKR